MDSKQLSAGEFYAFYEGVLFLMATVLIMYYKQISEGYDDKERFEIITKLLAVMNLTNVSLFAWCTVAIVIIFGSIYGIVYAMTAKVYYRIVS